MFDIGFPRDWSSLKKLIWLKAAISGGGASAVWKTVTGALIHLTDALASPMQKCEVTLEPIQDLHGQDAPYPAGGGQNLIDIGSKVSKTSAGVTYTSDENYITLNGTKSGGTYAEMQELTVSLKAGTYYAKAFPLNGEVSCSIYMYNGADLTSNITGTERTFTLAEDGNVWLRFAVWTDGVVFNNYKLGIVLSKSTISEWSPYSNICPITGWTGCEVNVTGENLLAEVNTPCFIPLDSGTKVTVVSNAAGVVYYYDKDMTQIDYWSVQGSGDYWKKTFTLLQNAYYFKFVPSSQQSVNVALYKGDIASPTYKPFGTTLSVTFPDSAGTVYGGTVDLVSGVLTVDYGEVDLGSLSWLYSSGATRFYINILSLDLNIKYPTDPSKALSGLCEELSVAPWATVTTNNINNAIAVKNDGTEFNVRCTKYTDAASFKTAMSGVQLVYELAEPIEIQLTPQEISTLRGENNVWGSGDIELTYKAQAE